MKERMIGKFKKMKKGSFRSYWEKRILAEIGYLIDLLYDHEETSRRLLEQAIDLLYDAYEEEEQISVRKAKEAEELLMPLSEKAKEITLIFAAHAHIDMNWQWGIQETVALTLDTMRTMLRLLEEYPEFVFSQSQASVYEIMEKYAPQMLEKVKKYIKEGRWEVTASTWVENDKNLSGGESMVRHILYTKKYLSKLLEINEEELNLDFEPDTFGHSANIPEILSQGGISRYYHGRGHAGENIYRWRSPSGAEVLTYREPKWYTMTIDETLCDEVPMFCRKYQIDRFLIVYGVGDHGGGPSRRDIERILDRKDWPLYPKVKFGTFREFFDYLEERKEQFPVVEQELNYIFTGCYTSQSRIKMANHVGERNLKETEILDCMAKLEDPHYQRTSTLEKAWRKHLFNQFHDILPGTGKVETREHAMGEFQKAMSESGAEAAHALEAICEGIEGEVLLMDKTDIAMGAGAGYGSEAAGNYGLSSPEKAGGPVRYMTLFNTTQDLRKDPTELVLWDWQEDPEDIRVTDMDENEYPVQVLETGTAYWAHSYVKILVWMPVPPAGYTICKIDTRSADYLEYVPNPKPRIDHLTDEPLVLENDKIKAVFEAETMRCISLKKKEDGTEWIDPSRPAGSFYLTKEETSQMMTSWRIGKYIQKTDLNASYGAKPVKYLCGQKRNEICYEITAEDLKVRVSITLDEGNAFLDYHVTVDFRMLGDREKGVPGLVFNVPFAYEAEEYRYAIPYGMIDRAPLAQDVPAMGIACALPKEGKEAVSLICGGKYGFRGDKNTLSVNLIRGSFDPDPYPEVGEHKISFALGIGSFEEETLCRRAEKYFHPILVRSLRSRPIKGKKEKSYLRAEGAVLSAVKISEDESSVIIRTYNPSKKEKEFLLEGNWKKAFRCDHLENLLEEVKITEDGKMRYKIPAGKVVSFCLK